MQTQYRLDTTEWDEPSYTTDVRLAELVKDRYGENAMINAVSFQE